MDNDYLTPAFINKQMVKREEGWGAMDNDYLTERAIAHHTSNHCPNE